MNKKYVSAVIGLVSVASLAVALPALAKRRHLKRRAAGRDAVIRVDL